jgi:hypothetical protein
VTLRLGFGQPKHLPLTFVSVVFPLHHRFQQVYQLEWRKLQDELASTDSMAKENLLELTVKIRRS